LSIIKALLDDGKDHGTNGNTQQQSQHYSFKQRVKHEFVNS